MQNFKSFGPLGAELQAPPCPRTRTLLPPFQKVSMIPSLILIWLAGLLWNLGPENCCTTGTGHSSSLKASIQPVLDSILARSWTFLRKENNSSFSLDVLGYFCKQVLLKLENSNCHVYHIVVILRSTVLEASLDHQPFHNGPTRKAVWP